MNLHVFQHVPFEGPARIGAWATARGHRVTTTRWFAGDRPPSHASVDALVVMGGPMGVYEEDKYAWLREEKRFIRQAILNGKRILGVCLGAQLLADVLGARVYPHTCKEIGWFPITRTPDATQSKLLAAFPKDLEVFHWHGDTFDIPAEATHVLQSAACPNQAFVLEERVVGLQFHIEIEPAGVDSLVRHCGNDLRLGRCVQSAAEIRVERGQFGRIHAVVKEFLDRFFGSPER